MSDEIPEFEKNKMTTSQPMKFDLLVVIERGFPSGAVSMHCPACGAHAVGADEKEAHQRLLVNIKRKEDSAWLVQK